jgi:hypothetical protein
MVCVVYWKSAPRQGASSQQWHLHETVCSNRPKVTIINPASVEQKAATTERLKITFMRARQEVIS